MTALAGPRSLTAGHLWILSVGIVGMVPSQPIAKNAWAFVGWGNRLTHRWNVVKAIAVRWAIQRVGSRFRNVESGSKFQNFDAFGGSFLTKMKRAVDFA